MKIIETNSADETEKAAADYGSCLQVPSVLALTGEMGSGKTVWVRGLAEGAGIDPRMVHSPTFTLLNIYEGDVKIYHIDTYRLKNIREFHDAGLEEILNTGEGIVAIEWADKIADILPGNYKKICFETIDASRRRITIRG